MLTECSQSQGVDDLPQGDALKCSKSLATVSGAPTKRGPGAPLQNRNRVSIGLYSFPKGKFPRGASWVGRQVHHTGRVVTNAVVERDGATSPYAEALISSVCEHEGRRLLLKRWLRLEGDSLPVLDRAALLTQIGRATDARDNCLRLLGLDKTVAQDPWKAVEAITMQGAGGDE